MGPTGSGKTELAERLAETLSAKLVNADAFQAYRGMDVGTGKPQDKQKYELLDIKDPSEHYGLGEFCKRAMEVLEKSFVQTQSVVVVGGTGLYIRGLFEEYEYLGSAPDPELRLQLQRILREEGLDVLAKRLEHLSPVVANGIDLKNPIRVTRALERALDSRPRIGLKLPNFAKVKLGISVTPAQLSLRIARRVQCMVQNGWVEEVQALLDEGYSVTDPGFRAIGYVPMASAIQGNLGLEEAVATTIAETRRYAKRQRTWLRSEPRLVELSADGDDMYLQAMTAIRTSTSGE